jgi:hypothetical protein
LFGQLSAEAEVAIRTGNSAQQFRHRLPIAEHLRIALGGRADNPVFVGADGAAPVPIVAGGPAPVIGPAVYELAAEPAPAPEPLM